MKIPCEEHSKKFGKVIAAMLKLAIFLGGACVVAYSLRIGRFSQGLTFGDSLLLVMAAICFGAVASLFVCNLVSLGIMLSPTVHIKQPYASLMPKALVSATVQAPTDYVAYNDVTVLFHGFGTVTVLAFRDGPRQRTSDIPNDYLVVERH
jgi:hypothetical protein